MGMTVVDWWGLTADEPNCLVINEINDERFYQLLTERIGRLP
jgi:purine nucleosidase